MRISWTRETFQDYPALALMASAGILSMSITNPDGEKLMTLDGGWKYDAKAIAKSGARNCRPMDTTITASTGGQYTAVCKMHERDSWSWTLGNYSSAPVVLSPMAPKPAKLEWTASDVGKALPGVEALPKKIYSQRLDGRVRTWSGKNGGCPKGNAAAEKRADDLLSVSFTADKKLGESTKDVTVREATLSVPSHLLRKYNPQELALILAMETDFFWSLGYSPAGTAPHPGCVLNIVDRRPSGEERTAVLAKLAKNASGQEYETAALQVTW